MKIRESCLQTGNFIYKPGISLTKQDFHLQRGSLGLQRGFSGYYLPYDNNYQVDGGLNVAHQSGYRKLANVFTTQAKQGVSSEDLKAVSLSITSKTNVNYTIEIYTDLKDKTKPTSGTKQETATIYLI